MKSFSKWVALWGNATSITDRKESTFAKNLTLRYPIKSCFAGNKLRFTFSNLTGEESIKINKAFVALQNKDYQPIPITFNNNLEAEILPKKQIVSDEISIDINRGDVFDVSFYLKDYTQMNAGTLITGPLSKGQFAYGDFANQKELPKDLTRNTNWFYFLNTIDIFTQENNRAIICYGDSITAQSWPDYLSLRLFDENITDISIIRRAVSGTRILRQYDCITYQAYGLKGETRFPIESNVSGASAVIIQHGINDIIHPVGEDVNIFRPWSDMPSVEDLILGVKNLYISHAKKLGLKIVSGTLLPIFGWRTYNENREKIRQEFNDYLRHSNDFDFCIDFDRAVRDQIDNKKFALGFDSGDHLHPSEKAYKAMAEAVNLKKF